jgi:hypothetical protein
MKTLVLAILLMASTAFAAQAPTPKYVAITTCADGATVYLAQKGKQTGFIYETTYVTIASAEAMYITFNANIEVAEFYTAEQTAVQLGLTHTYYVGKNATAARVNSVLVPGSSAKVTFKVSARSFTMTGVDASPSGMEVWAEYE